MKGDCPYCGRSVTQVGCDALDVNGARMHVTTLMSWEIYVTDDGMISCHDSRCGCDQYDRLFIEIGRRTTYGEMHDYLIRHIKENAK